MPPQVSYCHPSVTHKTPLLSPNSRFEHTLHQRYRQHVKMRMKLTKQKLIPLLVFVLFSASIFRFLNISMITTISPIHHLHCFSSPSSSICPKNMSHPQNPSLTEKETLFLLKILHNKVPCNILIFGQEYKYSKLASLNNGGTTLFITEDHLQKTSTVKNSKNNTTRVHEITYKYNTLASDAYKLLREARGNPECSPNSDDVAKASKCQLAMTNLPREVYDTVWDVVVVDGPGGSRPNSPGRMASIYTAGILARRGNTSHDVIVHDVDRTVEKWFSWEFLCEENLVASKGRFWHFHIPARATNATTFCTT